MGCISVSFSRQRQQVNSSALPENNIGSSADCRNAIISAISTAVSTGTEVSIGHILPGLSIGSTAANARPTVVIGLVCRVGPATDTYLMVEEGNLITIDGQYMKVMRV